MRVRCQTALKAIDPTLDAKIQAVELVQPAISADGAVTDYCTADRERLHISRLYHRLILSDCTFGDDAREYCQRGGETVGRRACGS